MPYAESDSENLHSMTKMLFVQAQTHTISSIDLIQAALLIATFEYAHGMVDLAYVSIGTCARMASAAKLIYGEQLHAESRGRLTSEPEEEQNLWWGIRTCETYLAASLNQPVMTTVAKNLCRFISLEMGHASRPLSVKNLHYSDELLFDVDLLGHPYETRPCQYSSNSATFSDPSIANHFAREVQAAHLYTDVIRMVQTKDFTAMQPELSRADHKLQTFFRDITYQCGKTWGLYCGSIALAIG